MKLIPIIRTIHVNPTKRSDPNRSWMPFEHDAVRRRVGVPHVPDQRMQLVDSSERGHSVGIVGVDAAADAFAGTRLGRFCVGQEVLRRFAAIYLASMCRYIGRIWCSFEENKYKYIRRRRKKDTQMLVIFKLLTLG